MNKVTFIANEANQKFAKDALECQNACNFLAVLNSLKRHIDAIRDSKVRLYGEDSKMPMTGTIIRQHPAIVLMINKLASLVDYENPSAWIDCEQMANGKNVEIEFTE
jgi:hypothetical protein